MSEKNLFDQELFNAINGCRETMRSEILPTLKADFSLFNSSFLSLYNILLKNRLIVEDAHRKSLKISDVQVPPKTQFPESKVKQEMTVRLSLYSSHLEFLISYCPFSLDYFTPKRLKTYVDFVRYIDWDNIRSGSSDFNTFHLSHLVATLDHHTRDLTSQIIDDAKNQLSKYSAKILINLKQISDFNREYYKYEVREQVISGMTFDVDEAKKSPDTIIDKIKTDFKIIFTTKPFYGDLVKEIIAESYGPNSSSLQENLISKLRSKKVQKKRKIIKDPYLYFLEKAIKTLNQNDSLLTESLMKLNASWSVAQNKKPSFAERLLKLLGIIKPNAKEKLCNLIYEDEATGTSRKKTVSLVNFITAKKNLINNVNKLGIRFSSSKKNINPEEEEIIVEKLNSYIRTYIKTTKDLAAFDSYFKKNALPENKSRLKGIKIELSAIISNVGSTRKLRTEYETKKSEEILMSNFNRNIN